MVLITKKEMEYLTQKGVNFGENGISMTGKLNGRHKYYLCEQKNSLKLLKDYRDSRIVNVI